MKLTSTQLRKYKIPKLCYWNRIDMLTNNLQSCSVNSLKFSVLQNAKNGDQMLDHRIYWLNPSPKQQWNFLKTLSFVYKAKKYL